MIPTEIVELAKALYLHSGGRVRFDQLSEKVSDKYVQKAYAVQATLKAAGYQVKEI